MLSCCGCFTLYTVAVVVACNSCAGRLWICVFSSYCMHLHNVVVRVNVWNTKIFTNICFRVIVIVQKVLYANKLSDCNPTETPPVPYHFMNSSDHFVHQRTRSRLPIKPTHSLSRAPDRSNRILHSLRKRSGVSWGVSGVIGITTRSLERERLQCYMIASGLPCQYKL